MALLLLNRRPILDRVPTWLPGASLIVVTERSAARSAPTGDFVRTEIVDDYTSPRVDRLIDAVCATGRIERVLTTAESDVVRAARARERHGLPGQRTASALAFRDKLRMRRLAARHGIAVPAAAVARDAGDVADFVRAHGLPVVVKPADGAGSVGVRVLRDRRAVRACVLPAGRTHLVERFVPGTVCHVDGLMSEGAVLHAVPSRYLHPNLATATDGVPSVSGMLAPRDPLARRLEEAASAVVAALPPVAGTTAFHAEFFHTPEDALVLCEIACRPGGCGIVEAHELATGVNLYAAQLRGQAGLPVPGREPGLPRHGWAWFPPLPATLERLPESCSLPYAHRFAAHGETGVRHDGPRSSTDSIAELVFRLDDGGADGNRDGVGDGSEDVTERLREVEDWWSREVRWAA
ncbi:acetyl-CoA carboxylase biotin carboxylase subunit family protein [Streptomyces sp. NPDC014894]|uniref:ATP-grasp domain-containing protein n=1 Tax=Streptomyces sp. NPDC014894 TaxID=3364931 RepID=UPI0036FACABE